MTSKSLIRSGLPFIGLLFVMCVTVHPAEGQVSRSAAAPCFNEQDGAYNPLPCNPPLANLVNHVVASTLDDREITKQYIEAIQTDPLLLSGVQVAWAAGELSKPSSDNSRSAIVVLALSGDKRAEAILKTAIRTGDSSRKRLMTWAMNFAASYGRDLSIKAVTEKTDGPKSITSVDLLTFPSPVRNDGLFRSLAAKVSLNDKLARVVSAANPKESLAPLGFYDLRKNPAHTQLHELLAEVLRDSNDLSLARQYAEFAIDSGEEQGSAENTLGNILLDQHDYAGAILHFEKSTQAGRTDLWPEFNIARAHSDMGQLDLAESEFRSVLSKIGSPEKSDIDPEMANDFAWFLVTKRTEDRKELLEAERYSQESVSLTADGDANFLDTFAAVEAALGKNDEAIHVEERSVGLAARNEAGSPEEISFEKRLSGYLEPLLKRVSAGEYGQKYDPPPRSDTAGFRIRSVIEEVRAARASVGLLKPPQDMFPGLPKPAVLQPCDCDLDYDCTCYSSYSFVFVKVSSTSESGLASELTALARTTLYGCYKQSNGFEEDTTVDRCRFSRVLQFSNGSSAAMDPTAMWRTELRDTRVEQAWFESAIRVDSNGYPVENVSPYARPIAVRTTDGLYLAYQIDYTGDVPRCELGQPIQNVAFDLTQCSDKQACGTKALSAYAEALESFFLAPPTVAKRDLSSDVPTGEWWFRRMGEKSVILGGPYYERTTYMEKWRAVSNKDGVEISDVWYGSKGRTDGPYLMMNLLPDVSIAVGIHGDYMDPESQMVKFENAAADVAKKTLTTACNTLHGRFEAGICVLGDRK
jgi:tetratricopeptide (TPR) repeat protein